MLGDGPYRNDCIDLKSSWVYWLFFILTISMAIISLILSIKFKAYRNESSMTLIMLVMLKWMWATIVAASFAW